MASEASSPDRFAPSVDASQHSRRLSRRAWLRAAVAGMAAAVASGCDALPTSSFRPEPTVVLPTPIPSQFVTSAPTPGATPAAPQPTERVRIAVPYLPADFEPLRAENELARTVLRAVFDPLVVRDDGGRVVPGLAAAYRNVDPLTWRFILREKIQFANGMPVTAEDVRYSIERAAERQAAFGSRAWFTTIRRVEILDSTTIHVVTNDPDPLVPARLVLVPIIPREEHRRVGEAEFAQQPVGSGPYRVRERTPEHLVLEAVDQSWRGRPLAREIELILQVDPNARADLLLAGQAEFAYDLPLERIRGLTDAGMRIVPAPQLNALVIEISYLTGGPLLDRRVRQALNYAVDKQAIVKQELAGYGQILQGQVLVPGVSGYAPAVRAYPYDPGQARDLLKAAGLQPGGAILSLDTLGGTYERIAGAVASGLNGIGIPTTLQVLPPNVHAERVDRGGRSPLFLLNLPYEHLLDADEVYERYLSTAPPESRRFANEEFDRLFARSRTEIDPTARRQLLEQLARIFHDEAPVIFVANEFLAHGLAPRLGGFLRQGDGVIALERLGVTG